MTMARGNRVNWRTGTSTKERGRRWHPLLLLLVLTARGVGGAESELADFRRVPYESLLHNMDQFTETGVSHFSEILFDVKRYQLIVGARDALFR